MNTSMLETAPPQHGRGRWELESAGCAALVAFAMALQFSIAISQILLTAVVCIWLALLVRERRGFEAPRFFWPLAAYAGATLVSSAFSLDPLASFIDDRQLLLLLVVPVAYRLARGPRADVVLNATLLTGGVSALVGIFQYAVLHDNTLHARAHGTVGHYMTYAGLLMLTAGIAIGTLLFARRAEAFRAPKRALVRTWPAFILVLLIAGLAVSFSRNAWVGAAAAATLLLVLRDVRLVWILPVAFVLALALAPARIAHRFTSIFNVQDATNRDRIAMLESGLRMVHDHPWFGVGPNMVERVYPQYREPFAVQRDRPHLHDVPMQIAAERGLPALIVWLWFIAVLLRGLWGRFAQDRNRRAAAAGLAALAGMLAAGLFEHNFGNSEFLMLFLLVVTVPFAAAAAHTSEGVTGRGGES